jgi:flagellar biosynthesis repressor protein FlbT
MTAGLNLSLKAGQKLYVNGAVLRVDRKVTLELLNEADFLLSHHVIDADQATTPLRQLYFVIQTMLMAPSNRDAAMAMYRGCMLALAQAFNNHDVLVGLLHVSRCVEQDRLYEGLKTLRRLLPIEGQILGCGRGVENNRVAGSAAVAEQTGCK